MTEIPGAVVIGGYINGLGMVRSLAARGLPVAVVTTEPYDIAQHSRRVSAHAEAHGVAEAPEKLIEVLMDHAGAWSGRILLPTTDTALAAVSAGIDRLASHYRILVPPPEAVAVLLDKRRMAAAAEAVGLSTPRCHGPATRDNPQLAAVSFPVIVKPLSGHGFSALFGCKVFEVADAAQLLAAVARVEAAGVPCLVFDLIPGRDDQIFAYCLYVDRAGRPGPGLTIRKLRQSPPAFGVARMAEVTADRPGLADQTIALLQRIGFTGMAAAEFKLDPRDGSFRFIEVNGRSVIYNGLLRRAGLDLAAAAVADLEGSLAPAAPAGWDGVWVNLLADLGYSLIDRRADPIGMGEFVAPYLRPMIEASWSWRDPAPFLAQWGRTLTAAVSPATRRP